MKAFIGQVIKETNVGYINSKIPIGLKLHCLINSNLRDKPSHHVMLNDFDKLAGMLLYKLGMFLFVCVCMCL